MKKVKLTGKLSLNKETIVKLNDQQMARAIGGQEENILSIYYCKSKRQACDPGPDIPDSWQAYCISQSGPMCNTCNSCRC